MGETIVVWWSLRIKNLERLGSNDPFLTFGTLHIFGICKAIQNSHLVYKWIIEVLAFGTKIWPQRTMAWIT